jgi:hypothetical protein
MPYRALTMTADHAFRAIARLGSRFLSTTAGRLFIVLTVAALAVYGYLHLTAQRSGFFGVTQTSGNRLTKGLVGWWTFDGPDMSSNVADKSGQGNNGTLVGFTSITTVPGAIGEALNFDGNASQYVNAGTRVYATQYAPFSVSVWVNLRSFIGSVPFILQLTSDTESPWFLFLGSSQTAYAGISTGSNSTWANIKTNNVPSLGGWHHIVVAYNGDGAGIDSNFTIYLDGVPQPHNAANTPGSATQADIIGNDSAGDAATQWNGAIDDVRIYNRALSLAEVKRLFALGK